MSTDRTQSRRTAVERRGGRLAHLVRQRISRAGRRGGPLRRRVVRGRGNGRLRHGIARATPIVQPVLPGWRARWLRIRSAMARCRRSLSSVIALICIILAYKCKQAHSAASHDSNSHPRSLGLCRRRAAAAPCRASRARARETVRRQQGGAGARRRASAPAACYPDAVVERFDDSALDGVDLVFAALPHGHSQRIARRILDAGIPFVDLGADFRLDDAATYQRWYGHAHEAPELLGRSSTAFRSSTAKPSAARKRLPRRAAMRLRRSSR